MELKEKYILVSSYLVISSFILKKTFPDNPGKNRGLEMFFESFFLASASKPFDQRPPADIVFPSRAAAWVLQQFCRTKSELPGSRTHRYPRSHKREKREQQQSKELGLCHNERPQEVKRRVKQRRRLNLRQTDRSQQDPGRTPAGPQRDRGSSQAAPSFTVQPPFACLSGGFQPITLLLNTGGPDHFRLHLKAACSQQSIYPRCKFKHDEWTKWQK